MPYEHVGFPQPFHALNLVGQPIQFQHHGHKVGLPGRDRGAQRFESHALVQGHPLFQAGYIQMGIAVRPGVLVEGPEQACKHGAVAPVRFHRQEADFHGFGSRRLQNPGIGEPASTARHALTMFWSAATSTSSAIFM